VSEAIDRLDEQWPGLRDRICERRTVLRPRINVCVDRERAELDTPVAERSRVADRRDQRRLTAVVDAARALDAAGSADAALC
jgi:hypothetical protein